VINKLLIVVDAQVDFVSGAMAVPGAKEAVAIIARMLGKFNSVFYTQDWHPRNHCSFIKEGGLWVRHCVANSTGSRIVSSLPLALGDIHVDTVRKGSHRYVDSYSAFWDDNHEYQTEMAAKIQRRAIADVPMKLYICGFATEYCVKATVVDALSEYNDVTVIDDACRGVDKDKADQALEEMADKGAMIIPSTLLAGPSVV
jgi:nicotinamidase/pyrazinamidase